MKKELLLACGLFLALPVGQGFAEGKTALAEKWSALQQHQTHEMKLFGFNEDEGTYYEDEPNDTFAKATPVETGYFLSGSSHNQSVNNGKDIDLYKFTLKDEEDYSLVAYTQNQREQTLKIRVLSSDGEEVAKSTLFSEDGYDLQSIESVLTPGTYYLEVTNSYSTVLNENYAIFHDVYEYGQSFERLAGEDRYETSVKISQDGWLDGEAETAVLATGANFPDALSATPLAYRYGAPLLLTRQASLPAVVKNELVRLGVSKVFIVGGTSAVSADVEKQVKNMGIKVTRLSGTDRYSTSVKIADEIGAGAVVVATGGNFADALSIAPIAAQLEMPILLSRKDSVPGAVSTFINNWDVERSYVIGGVNAISDAAAKKLPGVKRISGADRYATNSKIIDTFIEDIDTFFTYFATGTNYPDALAGSALAAQYSSPVILTNPAKANIATKTTVEKYMDQMYVYYILGGETALPQSAIDQLFAE
ncbi:cell wall-binding repeat-containing protein [Bacillus sp. OVS6]|nr:cell wall-binding repeat-containing protein [Bacillus sp. OVS6]